MTSNNESMCLIMSQIAYTDAKVLVDAFKVRGKDEWRILYLKICIFIDIEYY